ncbi:MAG: HDOD domain-containing protein [Polyangiaceae bacterium]|nr:HDOD domain-containing protein [Polyangiaceae bacterium]
MRILFVDDEPLLLEAIERTLFEHADKWKVSVAATPARALQRLAETSYDVVICDTRMRGMDGAQFLQCVQRQQPDALRIIFTGHTSEETALRALPVAQQFLSKPCSADEIITLIARTQELQGILNDATIRSAVGHLDRLPTVPRIYAELSRVIQDASTGAADVARVIERDPALCAKLLQVANSAFFARRVVTSDIQCAVVHLGLRTVRALVLQTEVFGKVEGADHLERVAEIQAYCLRVGTLAAEMMGNQPGRDEAFMAGLLSDVGQLALTIADSEPWKQARARAKLTGERLHETERAVMGTTHAEVGAFLLGAWGLPYGIVAAVAAHHAAERVVHPRFEVPAAVHIANALLAGEQPSPELIDRVGVGSRLDTWRARAMSMTAAAGKTAA